jgi:hypothetical protein
LTAFFIPGLHDHGLILEDAYQKMREQIEAEMGSRPSARRILRLWTRRGGTDCVTEVGCRDPLRGGIVMAIFDMGSHQPFVVWWQPDDTERDGVREVLRDSAYSTQEFDG